MNTLSIHDLKAVIDTLKEKCELYLQMKSNAKYQTLYSQLQTAEDIMDAKLQAIGIIL